MMSFFAKKAVRRHLKKGLILLAASSLLFGGCAVKRQYPMQEDDDIPVSGGIDTLTPANDFYGYINAAGMMERTIPQDEVSSSESDDLDNLVSDRITEIIVETGESNQVFEKGSNEQLIHDLYCQRYNEAVGRVSTDEADTVIADRILDDIESAQSMDELLTVTSRLGEQYGMKCIINASAVRDYRDSDSFLLQLELRSVVNLSDIIESDNSALNIKNRFVEALRDRGVSSEEAEERSMKLVYMLYDIAGYTDFDISEGKTVNYECVETVTPDSYLSIETPVSYEKLLSSVNIKDKQDKIYFRNPKQLKKVLSMMDDSHLQEWKDYSVYSMLVDYELVLPKKYNFSAGEVLEPEAAKDDAVRMVKICLPNQIAEIYVEKYFSEKKKKDVTGMCEQIRQEYYTLIDGADWLSEEGKAAFKEKLDSLTVIVGSNGPHTVNPDDANIIGKSFMETKMNIGAKDQKDNLNRLKGISVWGDYNEMVATDVNAYYAPNRNAIFISAAILDGVYYDEKNTDMENLGRIGMVIAHEISHAFDSTGVLYDEKGNVNPDRVPQKDREAFEAMKQNCIDYYGKFKVLGKNVNGARTLGENLADIGALQCCLDIAETPENQKTVFENYARIYAGIYLDSTAKGDLKTDVHSPGWVRVNAVVSCFDPYYEIYDVKEGDPMYVAPEDRIRRW